MSDGEKTAINQQVGTLLRGLFEHQVMLLTELVEGEQVPDPLVWRLASVLDASRRRAEHELQNLCAGDECRSSMTGRSLHPAFREFLHQLQKGHTGGSPSRPKCVGWKDDDRREA